MNKIAPTCSAPAVPNAGPIDIYQRQVIRAVRGGTPVFVGGEHDPAALLAICKRLMDGEQALATLMHKGWAKPGQSLVDVVRQLPVHMITAD